MPEGRRNKRPVNILNKSEKRPANGFAGRFCRLCAGKIYQCRAFFTRLTQAFSGSVMRQYKTAIFMNLE